MAISLEQYVKKLKDAETTTFPRAIQRMMGRLSLVAERESKRRATDQGGPAARTGRLRSSIRARVRGTGMNSAVVDSANTPYARLQEKGGSITPKKTKYLAIPLPAAKTAAGVARKGPRQYPDLFFYMNPANGNTLLMQKNPGGKPIPMFLLRFRVDIPARPYLKPGIDKARKQMPAEIHRALVDAIGIDAASAAGACQVASTLRTIIGAIKSTLLTINGKGSYTYDLQAADSVHIGSTTMVPTVPCVWLWRCRVPSTHDHALGSYDRDLEVDFVGVANLTGSTNEDPGNYFLAASDMLNDVSLALEADRTLGVAGVLDVILDAEADSSFQIENTYAGVVNGTIRVNYRLKTGF